MADLSIKFNEAMVGSGHPSKADTLNRLALVGHNNDGSHKFFADLLENGAAGDGSTDDGGTITTTLAANDTLQVPGGTFMCASIGLDNNNTITGLGPLSALKQNALSAEYVLGYGGGGSGTWIDEIAIDNLLIDGNKSLGTFTGEGSGLSLSYVRTVRIGRLEVKNCWGHGVVIRRCRKVIIDELITHDNEKIGLCIESDSELAQEIIIGKVIAYNNGNNNGGGTKYNGVDFGDTTSTTGPRKINIGQVIAFDNYLDGVAFGRNATGGDDGAVDMTFGTLLTYGNTAIGVELYGVNNIVGGSILSYDNGRSGVVISYGDDTATLSRNVQIDSINSNTNGRHGVNIVGSKNIQVGRIIAYNNSQETTTTYSGVIFDADTTGGTYIGNISIGSILAYDDQGAPTQKYGLENSCAVAPLGKNHVGYLRAFGNVTADLISTGASAGVRREISFDRLEADVILPTYSTNVDGANIIYTPFMVNGYYYGVGQTTDANNHALVRIPIDTQDKAYTIKAFVTASENGDITGEKASYEVTALARNNAGTTVVDASNAVSTIESTAGMTAEIIAGGAGTDYVLLRVAGVAATTIDWSCWVKVMRH